uniref:YpsA SLOG family protein n=1 Tax=Thaumasiovibrio occultus TaxID=1891184 RepID=UPI000B34B4E0|nr:putative molybdenum carrier protein [Thaumasiovibrio occultus]
MLTKIISGGQSGADIAALDAALASSIEIGGFCPKDRQSEVDLSRYPLIEIEGGYRQRTKENIKAADGTVIFYHADVQGGTELTLFLCIKSKSPYKLIDTQMVSPSEAAKVIAQFIEQHNITTLNVAGPSASRVPSIYASVKATLIALFQ